MGQEDRPQGDEDDHGHGPDDERDGPSRQAPRGLGRPSLGHLLRFAERRPGAEAVSDVHPVDVGIMQEVVDEIAAGLVAGIGVLGQDLLDDRLQPRRDVRLELAQGMGGLVHDLVDDRGQVLAGERLLQGQHLIEDRPEGEDVDAVVDLAGGHLLGGHVEGRAHHGARLGQVGGRDAGDPEIDDVGAALLVDKDVARLDVPVDDALLVGAVQAVGDLDDEPDRFFDRPFLARGEDRFQAGPIHILHGDIEDAVVLAHVVDGDDVGMSDIARRLGLAQEALLGFNPLFGLAVHIEADGLDGHRPVDERIEALVDDPHGTAADFLDDRVFADATFHC